MKKFQSFVDTVKKSFPFFLRGEFTEFGLLFNPSLVYIKIEQPILTIPFEEGKRRPSLSISSEIGVKQMGVAG
jgi:hypothetical protein